MGITNLKIKNFKTLADVDIPIKGLNVLIGPNACGKSTFLDVINLLSEAARGRLSRAVSSHGGMESILTSDAVWRDFQIETDFDKVISTTSRHILNLVQSGMSYEVMLELLLTSERNIFQYRGDRLKKDSERRKKMFGAIRSDLRSNAGLPPDRDDDWRLPEEEKKRETVIGLIEKLEAEKPLKELVYAHTKFLADSFMSRHVNTGPKSELTRTQALEPLLEDDYLLGNGGNLITYLYHLRTMHEDAYEEILNTVRVGFPGFEKLEFPMAGAGYAYLAWHERGNKYFALGDVSGLADGALRFLFLATLLLSPSPPKILLIDEPEIGLHPELQHILAELLQQATLRSQIFVATHSPSLISALKPEELIVCDQEEDGRAKLTRADTMDLDHWLKEFTLGELWDIGQIGGRT